MDHHCLSSKPSSSSSNGPCSSTPNTIITEKKQKKRKNNLGNANKRGKREVKLSTDPQSVAARQRRHRISDRFKILQSLVAPGGSKMDTVSMLEEAIHYVKYLKTQIWLHTTVFNNLIMAVDGQSSPSDSDHMHHPRADSLVLGGGPSVVLPAYQWAQLQPYSSSFMVQVPPPAQPPLNSTG